MENSARGVGGASDTATMAMDEIIGDYAAFFAQQKARLAAGVRSTSSNGSCSGVRAAAPWSTRPG